jgi:hypothetical protein
MPLTRTPFRSPYLMFCALCFVPLLLASKNFVRPVARAAFNYPAHDLHRDDKIAIAADPYDTPEKAKIFTINFADHGLLPIFFIVTNDGDQPVSVARMDITLITANHSKLTPLSTDDLYRRLSNPQTATRPSPLPLPNRVKGTLNRKQMDELDSSQFAAKAVEPHTTQSGFLYFDIDGIASPLRGSNIEITGVDDAHGNELMFFEISLDKYFNAPSNP